MAKTLYYDEAAFAERLHDLRKERKLTLVQLSGELEGKTGLRISDVTLGKYENSDAPQNINASNLMALADYYDVSCDELLRGVKPENLSTNKLTGLSDASIDYLSRVKDYDGMTQIKKVTDEVVEVKTYKDIVEALNFLLEHDDEYQVMFNIARLLLGCYGHGAVYEDNSKAKELIDIGMMDSALIVQIIRGLHDSKTQIAKEKNNDD